MARNVRLTHQQIAAIYRANKRRRLARIAAETPPEEPEEPDPPAAVSAGPSYLMVL